MQFRKIFDGKADEAKTFELINRGYSPDVFQAGDWFEIDAQEFWYFFEVMPPMDYQMGAFSMCEFSTGTLTNAFISRADRYFCLTISRQSGSDFVSWVRAFDRTVNDSDKVMEQKWAASE